MNFSLNTFLVSIFGLPFVFQNSTVKVNHGNKKWKDDKMSFHFQKQPPEVF